MKREMEVIIVLIVESNYLIHPLSMKVVQDGHLFMSHYLMFSKLKQIIY